MRGLKDKVVLITGGGNGIGRATCVRFAEEGAKVGIFDIDARGAEETARLVREAGGDAHVEQCDITEYDQIEGSVRLFERAFGPTQVLVNNAGWDQAGPFLKTDPYLWQKIIDINLYGPLNMHHIVVTGMAERKQGRVINIASDAGRVGSSGEAIYSACKVGVIAFSKTLARELANSNVQVNTLCPGPTDTALFRTFAGEGEDGEKLVNGLERAIPMRRLGQPDDYPGMIAFLASDDASYITGQTLSISGGLTMS